MANFGSMVGSIEKLNEYNYRDWRSCIKFYLKGQDLWEVVDGKETSPPDKDDKKYNSWIVKASKAMYVIMTTIDKSLRTRIEDAETPKEAWDILASLFSKKNPARLQLLEKELMNTSQGTLSINEYFLKVKNLCREIEQLDAEAKFGDARIRRIITNGLKPEYNSFIVALQGWEKQPSLIELENLLANQEALEQQISKVTIKPQEIEEALFSAKSASQRFKKKDHAREDNRRRCKNCGHKPSSDDEEDSNKEEHRQQHQRQPGRGDCFICGRKGHYARDCKFLKKNQSNFAKMDYKNDDSEEEWDFEATYAVEEDVAEEEEWDLSENNDELWIDDLEADDKLEEVANPMIVEGVDDQYEDDQATKREERDYKVETKVSAGFALEKEKMNIVMMKSGIKEWLEDASVNECKDNKKESVCYGVRKQGEPYENMKNIQSSSEKTKKINDHSKARQIPSPQLKMAKSLIKERPANQVKHAEFDIRANIKRPPDKEDQLDIKGEY